MRTLEFFETLSKLLHDTSQLTNQSWLDQIAVTLMLFVALCLIGAIVFAVSLSLLMKIQPRHVAAKINVGAVLTGTFVSYLVWLAACWLILFLFILIFASLHLQFAEIFAWVTLAFIYIVSFVAIAIIGAAVRSTTHFFPRGHACVVGLLFIAIDLLVRLYIPFPASLGQPIVVYAGALGALCLGDVFLAPVAFTDRLLSPMAWTREYDF